MYKKKINRNEKEDDDSMLDYNNTLNETEQPKWTIDADLSDSQFKEAFKMLETGMKPRKVAFYFGFHRSKIRPVK